MKHSPLSAVARADWFALGNLPGNLTQKRGVFDELFFRFFPLPGKISEKCA